MNGSKEEISAYPRTQFTLIALVSIVTWLTRQTDASLEHENRGFRVTQNTIDMRLGIPSGQVDLVVPSLQDVLN